MADRRFDVYMPGGSDQLEMFVESIMAGRYLFFAIKVSLYVRACVRVCVCVCVCVYLHVCMHVCSYSGFCG